MLFFRQEPALLTVSRSEQHEAIAKLITATTLRGGYYLLLVLSVLIVTCGLLINNTAIIIGGMVIAPLLLPILALSLSCVARSVHGIVHALGVLLLSIVITIALAYGMTAFASMSHITLQWIPNSISPTIYLTVAFCSGIAAVFAWVKEDISSTIAGIAITVSLQPPLCAAGIALALSNLTLATTSLRIFALNVAGILLAGILVFILLGFLRTNKVTDDVVKKTTGE